LVVGFTNGTVHLLDGTSLRLLSSEDAGESAIFREGDARIEKIVFSVGGYFATNLDVQSVLVMNSSYYYYAGVHNQDRATC
jgi:hypothetical protein